MRKVVFDRGALRGTSHVGVRVLGVSFLLGATLLVGMAGCAASPSGNTNNETPTASNTFTVESDKASNADSASVEAAREAEEAAARAEEEARAAEEAAKQKTASADALRAKLNITEDYRASFVHGDKGASYQKYIVLHDTEGTGDGESVVQYWDGNGSGVAAHFIVNTDGSIVQCVPLDKITHHAGYGDTGHNAAFGITEDGRDDMVGTVSIGSWASDYGMNAWSIGIEMVHVGGSGDYPEAQLVAVDNLIAYINAYYGFASMVTDHKAWRTGNSDTSEEFATYLANYIDHGTHN